MYHGTSRRRSWTSGENWAPQWPSEQGIHLKLTKIQEKKKTYQLGCQETNGNIKRAAGLSDKYWLLSSCDKLDMLKRNFKTLCTIDFPVSENRHRIHRIHWPLRKSFLLIEMDYSLHTACYKCTRCTNVPDQWKHWHIIFISNIIISQTITSQSSSGKALLLKGQYKKKKTQPYYHNEYK